MALLKESIRQLHTPPTARARALTVADRVTVVATAIADLRVEIGFERGASFAKGDRNLSMLVGVNLVEV